MIFDYIIFTAWTFLATISARRVPRRIVQSLRRKKPRTWEHRQVSKQCANHLIQRFIISMAVARHDETLVFHAIPALSSLKLLLHDF